MTGKRSENTVSILLADAQRETHGSTAKLVPYKTLLTMTAAQYNLSKLQDKVVEMTATTNTFTESDFSSKEDGVMTQKQYELLQFVTDDVLQPTIGLLGIAGNILSLVVFSQPQVKMASSIRVYLRALCVIDLVFLIFNLYESMLELLTPVSPNTISMLQAFSKKYEQPFQKGLRGSSTFMVVIIAFERFFAISLPMSANKSCLKRYPYLPIALVLLFNFIFAIFFLVSFDPLELPDGSWAVIKTTIGKSDFLRVYGIIAEVSYLLIPMALVSIFNVCTVCKLYVAKRKRQHMTSTPSLSNNTQASRMLLGVALLFNVCILPSFVVGFIQLIHPSWRQVAKQRLLLRSCFSVARLLSRLSSSANFFVYVMTSQKFCNALTGIVRKKARHKASNSESTSLNSLAKY
ncbi:hypothetical protein CAPTEDRAFT_207505 [Capitella teleta]|uniref:G-protein coupled receptors family 1 profile domain-containing protein n=1 Tax=Capitella teleta TaxID=283909 RepID=R7U3E0_CAPTE|nr:hypothetical protein CAPTEDRAFT_207505 [Capitella teleta]|eukprot:ELU00641.1 hypothetical protein CAPTEDRAFT_207505 [Capitella teleta]